MGHSRKYPAPPPRRKSTISPSPDILYKFKTFLDNFPPLLLGQQKFLLWVEYGSFLERPNVV